MHWKFARMFSAGDGEREMNAALAAVIAAYQMIPRIQLSIPKAGHVVFMTNFSVRESCAVS